MAPANHLVKAPVEIDLESVDLLAEDLARAPEGGTIEVDCSEVSFMDSAGVRALSMAAQRQEAGGGELRVVRPTKVVRRILEVTALAGLIDDEAADPERPPAPPER